MAVPLNFFPTIRALDVNDLLTVVKLSVSELKSSQSRPSLYSQFQTPLSGASRFGKPVG
jgi:hypothetical protein